MPAVRQPLRKRCNVKLSVVTSCDDISRISKDETSIRGRPQRRQKRTMTTKRISRHSLKGEDAVSALHHLQSYCELIPFLTIALSDGSFDPSTLLPPITSSSVVPFTHFIRIQHSTPLLNPGLAWSEYHLKTGISVLNLIVPASQSRQHETCLSEHQLLLSRDFLSLALPYYYRSDPPTWNDELPSGDMAHVLITAPPGPPGPFLECVGSSNAVDVMSIVACYLSFAGREKTTTVVKCVDSESGLADIWKGRIKGDGVEIVQRVAIAI